MKLRNYTSEKIFDPRNTHEKKIWTHEILTWKNFGLTKDPCKKILDPRNTHKGTMEHDPWNLAHSVKVYTYSESLFNTLCIEIKKILRKKWPLQKMHPFFFPELQLITVLLSIHNSYVRWSARFISLKLCVGFSIFDSVLFLWKFIFLFN